MTEDVALKWAGNYDAQGRPVAFFAGVPARDLTAAEVAALPKDQAAEIVTSGLYTKPERKPAKKAGE